jgi:Domain of unknown function (DUF6134)
MFIARRRFIGGLVGVAAGATLSVSSLWTRPALAVPQSLHFKAYRDKSPVGTHTVDVQSSGNQMNVTIKIDLNVNVAFVTLFEFNHDCEEIWQSGRLVSLRSKTNDNGDKFQVTAEATPEGIRIEGPGGPAIAPADAYTSNSVWNTAVLEQKTVIDAQHGGIIGLSVSPRGEQQVAVAGRQVPAEKYQVVTPFVAGNVWYDEAGRWVKALFEKDGEQMEYRLVA